MGSMLELPGKMERKKETRWEDKSCGHLTRARKSLSQRPVTVGKDRGSSDIEQDTNIVCHRSSADRVVSCHVCPGLRDSSTPACLGQTGSRVG